MAPARDAEKDQRRDREEPEDEFDRIEQHLQLARVEPAFEHRDDPGHDAEVRCVIGVLEQQPQPVLQGIDRVGPLVGIVEAPMIRSLALIVNPFSIFIPFDTDRSKARATIFSLVFPILKMHCEFDVAAVVNFFDKTISSYCVCALRSATYRQPSEKTSLVTSCTIAAD